MAFASRLMRFGIVFVVVGTIASQIPASDATAFAHHKPQHKNKCKKKKNTEYKIVKGTRASGPAHEGFPAQTGDVFSTYFDDDDGVIGNYSLENSNWTISNSGWSFQPGNTPSRTNVSQVTVNEGSSPTATLTAQRTTDTTYFNSVTLK